MISAGRDLHMSGLKDYVAKRDFSKTPEPGPAPAPPGPASVATPAAPPPAVPAAPPAPKPHTLPKEATGRFVVQEHHARSLHWDLRLELDGTLKSWAVPKGVPEETGLKRLAVEVEDHPVEYLTFHGSIPEGQYGAGTVEIWDEGYFALVERNEGKYHFALMGKRLRGLYILIRTKANQWLLWKRLDERGGPG